VAFNERNPAERRFTGRCDRGAARAALVAPAVRPVIMCPPCLCACFLRAPCDDTDGIRGEREQSCAEGIIGSSFFRGVCVSIVLLLRWALAPGISRSPEFKAPQGRAGQLVCGGIGPILQMSRACSLSDPQVRSCLRPVSSYKSLSFGGRRYLIASRSFLDGRLACSETPRAVCVCVCVCVWSRVQVSEFSPE